MMKMNPWQCIIKPQAILACIMRDDMCMLLFYMNVLDMYIFSSYIILAIYSLLLILIIKYKWKLFIRICFRNSICSKSFFISALDTHISQKDTTQHLTFTCWQYINYHKIIVKMYPLNATAEANVFIDALYYRRLIIRLIDRLTIVFHDYFVYIDLSYIKVIFN